MLVMKKSLLFALALAVHIVGIKSDDCNYDIVESMPDQLTFNQTIGFKPTLTHEALIDIIRNANKTLRIASFYWTLSSEDEFAAHPSTIPGRNIMSAISEAVKERGVDLQVTLDHSSKKSMNNANDIKVLETLGPVRYLNMSKLLKAGVLHSKFLIADNKTFYVGSSNFDWRSYTQIKEIGIRFTDCQVLAQDLNKIFDTYMYLSDFDQVPETLPANLRTDINSDHPLDLTMGQLSAKLFLAGSPPAFNGLKEWIGRTDDIDGLLRIINSARHSVDISVMNYSPRTEFVFPKRFWPRIDEALRRAASERRVRVRLLFSDWSKDEEMMWYRSLNAVQSKTLRGGGIQVRIFKVPAFDEFQKKLKFARVKHDKYMVTDNGLYIGTSNWAPDYFINTCGVSVVIQPAGKRIEGDFGDQPSINGTIIGNMRDLFERDFYSSYSQELQMI